MTTNNNCDYSPIEYNIQSGSTSGLLNNITPSATSGIPLISQGSSSQPIMSTLSIAGGGTNATSFGTSNGIIAYNGTSLVNYSSAKINNSGQSTNSATPAFCAYLLNSITNTTGDGTGYNMVYDTTILNVGSCYNTSTGLFTAPVSGNYAVTYSFYMTTSSTWVASAGRSTVHNQLKVSGTAVYKIINLDTGSGSNTYQNVYSMNIPLSAGDTLQVYILANTVANTLNTTIVGGTPARMNTFSVALIC